MKKHLLTDLQEQMLALKSLDITVGDVRRSLKWEARSSDNCHCHMAQAFCRTFGVEPEKEIFWAGQSLMSLWDSVQRDYVVELDHTPYTADDFERSTELVVSHPTLPDNHIIKTIEIYGPAPAFNKD